MNTRRSFNLALPASDPRSRRIAQWLDDQPSSADLSALLREVICAGLERQDVVQALGQQAGLLERIAADLAELRRNGVAVAPSATPEAVANLAEEDLAALGDLFSSFDES